MNMTLEELDVIFSTRSLLIRRAEKELRTRGIDPKHPLKHLQEGNDQKTEKTISTREAQNTVTTQ